MRYFESIFLYYSAKKKKKKKIVFILKYTRIFARDNVNSLFSYCFLFIYEMM